MDIKIEANTEVLERAKAKLSSSQISAAMRMAINEGLTKGRTEVRRGVQEVYNMRTAVLNNDTTGLKIKKATGSNLTGNIAASNKPLPISEASPKFRSVTIGRSFTYNKDGKVKKGAAIKRSVAQISIEIIKGQRKTINTAFAPGRATNATSGKQSFNTAIFARGKRGKPGFKFAKPRMPIDTISTVSPGTAASNERSVNNYSNTVTDYANKRFVYHIERMIKEVEGLQ